MAELALEGVRVLDLSRVLAGPFCAALLADMGAQVLKIEHIEGGDEARFWVPQRAGESAAFVVNNRNKRGVAIDLKTPDGVSVLERLAARADVLVENFRTGTMEEFGLGYERLSQLNPRLIYCSVSAFGRSGPRAKEGGYEALMQAFSGMMSITGEPGGAPVRSGASVIDLATGILSAFGIVSALQSRAKTGLGQRVDASLLGTAIGLLNYHAQGYLMVGDVPRQHGSAHPALAPYRNFRCADGKWVFIAGANDRLARRLLTALGLGALCDDPKFSTNVERVRNRAELDRRVGDAIGQHGRDELLRMLEKAGFPASPVNTVDEALADPQIAANGLLWEMDHASLGRIPVVGFPLTFSGMQPRLREPAPRLGEHTDQALAEIGYSPAEIAALRAKRVIR